MRWGKVLVFVLLAAVVSCQQVSVEEATDLVERYNRTVSEAYRRCDVKLIDPVVGPNTAEGKNLTGLIGVRQDMGITLDAELLSLEVTDVGQNDTELLISTKESWRYRDRKIGTAEQVGEESLDVYELLYVFKQWDGVWMVDETKFTTPPEVGRETTPWGADARTLHGFTEPAAKGENQAP